MHGNQFWYNEDEDIWWYDGGMTRKLIKIWHVPHFWKHLICLSAHVQILNFAKVLKVNIGALVVMMAMTGFCETI